MLVNQGHTTKKQLSRGSSPETYDFQDCALHGTCCTVKRSFLLLSQDLFIKIAWLWRRGASIEVFPM